MAILAGHATPSMLVALEDAVPAYGQRGSPAGRAAVGTRQTSGQTTEQQDGQGENTMPVLWIIKFLHGNGLARPTV